MDRYVIREPRVGVDYPEGNQMISFSTTSSGNTYAMPQNMYYSYDSGVQGHMPGMSPRLAATPTQTFTSNLYSHQGQIVSGIDPCYLAQYSDNNTQFMNTGYVGVQPTPVDTFGVNYQNHNFIGPERTENKHFIPQRTQNVNIPAPHPYVMPTGKHKIVNQKTTEVQPKPKGTEINLMKNEEQVQVKTRKEKLKELHVTGTRVFSGPVEKILKWNKSLQDIGVMVLYEVVGNVIYLMAGMHSFLNCGKCISIRPGDGSAKNLVIRDESGPAIQVVYYEIDFLLPELRLPCTVRVLGRMLSGSARLQAFSVRAATADDVTALPRRVAVATHHVTKLCEEYGA